MNTQSTTQHGITIQTPAELARELRCDRRKIYAAIASGELRTVKLGRWHRILPEDRDAWLDTLRATVAGAGA